MNNKRKSADWYRKLSMAYATNDPLPVKTRRAKVGTKAQRRQLTCLQIASKEKLEFAYEMRHKMTAAEVHLWRMLSKLSSKENPIEPQVVIGGYIADFCWFRYRLVIEVDGPIHDSRKQYDRIRDGHLMLRGYRTLRFTNEEVMNNRALVIGKIVEAT